MAHGAQFVDVSGTVQWKGCDMKAQSRGLPGGSGGKTQGGKGLRRAKNNTAC